MGKRTPLERYWAKVDTSGGPNSCWPWTAGRDKNGYGTFGNERAVSVRATRWGYATLIAPIPVGHFILHKCDNPPCMNPAHWFTGTVQDNADDMVAKKRQATGDRTGARLHPELMPRGDRHGSRTKPERLARGERHGSKTKPERVARGVRHGTKTHPEAVLKGERNGRAKLSAGEVTQLREMRANGAKTSVILETFGIKPTQMYRIIKGESWKHVA